MTRGSEAGLRWSRFAAASPNLAGEARRLFTGFGVPLGFLATVRLDGGPRVHPVCPLFDEDLHVFVVPGPKQADLRRDGRYALHCETYPPPRHEDAAYLAGTAAEVTDPERFVALKEVFFSQRPDEPWPGFDDQALFELRVDRVLVTMTADDGPLAAGHTVWATQ